jgi:DNA-binding NtrC family response regulator
VDQSQVVVLTTDLALRTRVHGAVGERARLVVFEDEARALSHVRDQGAGVFVIDARTRVNLAEGYARRVMGLDQPPELMIVASEELPLQPDLHPENVYSGKLDDDSFGEQLRRLLGLHSVRRISGIVGRTPAIQELLATVVQVAPLDLPVLIHGESGTGKEMVARSLHAMSERREGPFVSINVGSLAESLLESELFGHEKGAFTGAVHQHLGVFERARGGTLLLDELGEISAAMQVKLLRVLESGEFQRVGGSQTLRTDVRIVGATHRDLQEEMRKGRFRSDLYYRLKVVKIEIPPLRDRQDDILVLAQHFLEEVNRQHGFRHRGFTVEAMKRLRGHAWPGNVRELRNVVSAMSVMSRGEFLGEDDLPTDFYDHARDGAYYPVPAGSVYGGEGGPADQLLTSTLLQILSDMKDILRRLDRIEERLPASAVGPARGELDLDEGMRVPTGDLTAAEAEFTSLAGEAPGDLPSAERALIDASLRQYAGNRRKAAEQLGISERTLYRKIQKYGL